VCEGAAVGERDELCEGVGSFWPLEQCGMATLVTDVGCGGIFGH